MHVPPVRTMVALNACVARTIEAANPKVDVIRVFITAITLSYAFSSRAFYFVICGCPLLDHARFTRISLH